MFHRTPTKKANPISDLVEENNQTHLPKSPLVYKSPLSIPKPKSKKVQYFPHLPLISTRPVTNGSVRRPLRDRLLRLRDDNPLSSWPKARDSRVRFHPRLPQEASRASELHTARPTRESQPHHWSLRELQRYQARGRQVETHLCRYSRRRLQHSPWFETFVFLTPLCCWGSCLIRKFCSFWVYESTKGTTLSKFVSVLFFMFSCVDVWMVCTFVFISFLCCWIADWYESFVLFVFLSPQRRWDCLCFVALCSVVLMF